MHARHVLHQHSGNARLLLLYRRSHIRLGVFCFHLQLFGHFIGTTGGLRHHLLVALLSLVSVQLDLSLRFVFGLFDSRRFFCSRQTKRERKGCEWKDLSSAKPNPKENDRNARRGCDAPPLPPEHEKKKRTSERSRTPRPTLSRRGHDRVRLLLRPQKLLNAVLFVRIHLALVFFSSQ